MMRSSSLLLLLCLGGGWCACMYACFRPKGFAHRELMRATRLMSACLLQERGSSRSKAREARWLARWRFESARCVHVRCLLLERETKPTRTYELIRAVDAVLLVRREISWLETRRGDKDGSVEGDRVMSGALVRKVHNRAFCIPARITE